MLCTTDRLQHAGHRLITIVQDVEVVSQRDAEA